VPIRLTSYDKTAIQGSTLYTATSPLAQAYAHPYEGFAYGVAVVGSLTSTNSAVTTVPTTSANSTSNPNDTQNHRRASSGAIAGAVVSSLLGILVLLSAIWLFFRNRRIRAAQYYNTENPSSGYRRRSTFNTDYPSPLTTFSHGSHTNTNTTTSQSSSGEQSVNKGEDLAETLLRVHELDARPGLVEMDTNGFGSPRYNEKQH
jgi:hypothetical protein